MSKIKAVLWDIDGTLLNFKASEKNAVKECFKAFGFGECTDEMIEVYSGINQKYWAALERGEVDKKAALVLRFKDFFSLYGIPSIEAEEFNKTYQVKLGDTAEFVDGAVETLKRVRERGIFQFGVTNGTKTAQTKKLQVSGLIDMLDGVFISDEIGFEKPSEQFFTPVLAEVYKKVPCVGKEEIIIVGDSLTSDVKGGINIRIKTCWFNADNREKREDITPDYIVKDVKEVINLL